MRARRTLTRIHLWLGWLIGVPLLFWTVSGLWMVARPIEEVRGAHLRAAAPPLALSAPAVHPPLGPKPVKTVTLEQQPGGPRWIVAYADGSFARAEASGRWLQRPGADEAKAIARATYLGKAKIVSTAFVEAGANPLELRRERPAWQVAFGDGAHVYVDAESGSVLALRTPQWRAFDLMWGLHIMDLQTREDTSNWPLILFGALAAAGTLLALILLPFASRRKSRKRPLSETLHR